MPIITTRDAYLRGQTKVETREIQSQVISVSKQVNALIAERAAKLEKKFTATQGTAGLQSGMDKMKNLVSFLEHRDAEIAKGVSFGLDGVGGGVCHGLVYAWFQSLGDGRTRLDFDVDRGGWKEQVLKLLASTAGTNQARLNARLVERQDRDVALALDHAAKLLARESGFSESVALAQSGVTAAAIGSLLATVIDKDYPACYRISITAAGGKHSIGLIRKGSLYWLLDPNVGVVEYAGRERLGDDLADVLGRTPAEGGYGARSLRVLVAEPLPKEVEEDFDTMLARLAAGN